MRVCHFTTLGKQCNCGEANEGPTSWIAGGQRAGLDEFPWVVSLHDVQRNSPGGFICTGALIDTTHVLTAAHCVQRDVHRYKDGSITLHVILAGNNKINPHPQHVKVDVTKINLHPSYDYTLWNHTFGNSTYHEDWNGYDIAILTLAAPVQYSRRIKPVCLSPNPRQDYGNRDAVLAGYGLSGMPTVDGRRIDYDELMKKMETIIPDVECLGEGGEVELRRRVRVRYGYPHNVHLLCSHEPGNGSAVRMGDSGSALNLMENGRFVSVFTWLACRAQVLKASTENDILTRTPHFTRHRDSR